MSPQRDLVVRALRASGSLWEAVSESLDLPMPSLMGLLGANPYGIDVGKLVHLRDTLDPHRIMDLKLEDLIGGAISDDEAVHARYLEWIAKAKEGLLSTRIASGSSDAGKLRKELSAARKQVVSKRSPTLVAELKATGKKLDESARSSTSIRLKIQKGKKPPAIKADATPISEIFSELLGRLEITDHVASITALVHHAEVTRSVTKGPSNQNAAGAANSLGELAARTTSGPSLLALLSKGLHLARQSLTARTQTQGGGNSSLCTTVMGVVVCDGETQDGEGHPDGPTFGRRYVIHTPTMTLERGPGFRVDAFDVLDTALQMFEIASVNLAKDANHARTYVIALLDALADAFKMPASHRAHSHSQKHGGGRGGLGSSSSSKMIKIVTTTGGCALCSEQHLSRLERLGIAKKGGAGGSGKGNSKDNVVYVQNVPNDVDKQHLRNDTYFATCFGCLVAIEACSCCIEFAECMEDE